MKKALFVLSLLALSAIPAGAQLPATVHATWTPNPVSDNVLQYALTLDSATTPLIVLASACNTTQCPTTPLAITVSTFGLHTVSLVAQNLALSGVPTSIQSGPAATASFTLAAAPVVAPQALNITR